MENTNPRTIGKYEILSVIGEGGMGIVYKARDPIIDRIVAVKTIKLEEDGTASDELLARLRMEAKAAGRLHHPNIVTVFDFGQQGDLSFLVMEYVEGANLARIIAKKIPLTLEHKLDICIQLSEAVGYAHGLGVVHRDIKPSNICITRSGEPKILDFGLARFDETRLTRTGMTSGTLLYMSPERMSGESGPSDDIFALGAVIYELLTGQQAFPGEKYSEIVHNILSGNYPTPPSQVADLPRELDPVIAKATARDKANRHQSGAELAHVLRDIRYSATVRRRVDAQAAAGAFATVAMPLFTDNPYTAGSVGAPELSFGETVRDFETQQAAAAPRAPQPTQEVATELMEKQEITPDQYAPTETFEVPAVHEQSGSFFNRTRTVVVRAIAGLSGKQEAQPAPAAMPTMISAVQAAPRKAGIPLAAIALILATALSALAGSYGTSAYLGVYAAAVAAWFLLVRNGDSMSLSSIYALFAIQQATVAFQHPFIVRTVDAAAPPVASMLAPLLVAWPLVLPRVLIIAAMALAIRLMWDKSRPRRALGFATFPLLVIEGTLNAHLAVLAAVLLAIALLATHRQREGFGGLAAFVAIGLFAPLFVTIPQFWEEAYHVAPLMAAAAVVVIATKLVLPPGHVWMQPLAAIVAGSPILSFCADQLSTLLHARNVAATVNALSADTAKRISMNVALAVTDHGIAIAIVFIAVMFIANIVTRAATAEAMIADGIGITLLLMMPREPAAWIAVVPFAIMSNRTLWLLIATCSPILMLSTAAGSNWIVFGVSVMVPAAWWLGLKLQDMAQKGSATGTVPAH